MGTDLNFLKFDLILSLALLYPNDDDFDIPNNIILTSTASFRTFCSRIFKRNLGEDL